ncbi:MAG: peptidylprolyl isomerase [Ignavibacteria bacterium]|nr:peptidylprolyl isomerase [Ignavibacteria bacterium]
MKNIIFICLFFITTGCTVFQPDETTLIQPKLLKQSELPPIRESIFKNSFDFFCEMLINTNGDVERAKLLTGTGDAIWDSLAVLSLLQWKYAPAIYDGKPIKLMVRRKILVVFAEPKMLSLAEIQLDNLVLADSVYSALLSGADFTSLVIKHSTSKTRDRKGLLGDVNVRHYSETINAALNQLDEGEFTKPLIYGEHYIIFIRLKHNN